VEQRRDDARAAEEALRDECRAAVHSGVPKAAVARAAQVARSTLDRWLREDGQR
jgi:DNA-binding phage protein